MSLQLQSLAAMPETDQVQTTQTVLIRTPAGVVHVPPDLLFNFFTTGLRERVEFLELGNEGPAFWPLPRELRLQGAVSGAVYQDGTADAVMDVTIPDGSILMTSVDGLASTLLGLRMDVDNKAEAGHTHQTALINVTTEPYSEMPVGISVAASELTELPVQYSAVLTANAGLNRVGQLIIGSQSDELYFRGYRLGEWGTARKVYHDGNFDPNNLVGDTVLAGDFLPDVDNLRSLGAPGRVWRDVYIGPGSLYLNGQKILEDTESGTIRMTADANQNIAIQTKGTGDVELNPLGTGMIQLKGPVVFQAGELIRSSTGAPIPFDDSIEFRPGAGIIGGMTIDGYTTWHSGNLTPALYALLGATVNFASVRVGSNDVLAYEPSAHTWGLRVGQAGGYRYLTYGESGEFNLLGGRFVGDAIYTSSATTGVKVRISNKVDLTDLGIANTMGIVGGADATMAYLRFGNSTNGFGWNGSALVFGSDQVWHAGTFDPNSKLGVGATAVAATRLATARTIAVDGVVTASGQMFDGTAGVTLTTTIADAALSIAKTSGLQAILDTILPIAQKGAAGGVAPLDGTSKIPAQYLPSFVDDVLEYANTAVFPATGEGGKLYVALNDNTLHRWSGSTYVNITSTSGSADSAARWSTARTITLTGRAAGSASFDGSANFTLEVTDLDVDKFDVGLGNVDNTSDANKPVSTAQQAAIDLRAPLTGIGAYGNWPIGITGKSATTDKLAAAVQVALSGVITAPATPFDGSANLTLATSIADAALSIAKTSGLQTALDRRPAAVSVPSGININGSVTAGYFALPAGCTNGPVADPNGWLLVVERGLSSQIVTQTMYNPAGTEKYYRASSNAGAGWGAWMRVWHSGNFDPATATMSRWTTARALTLSGKASGTVSIDGSQDVTLNVTALNGVPSDVGLGNVNNTSDAAKPLSDAAIAALLNKVSVGGAAFDYLSSVPPYHSAGSGMDCNDFQPGHRALVDAIGNSNTPGLGELWYIETAATGSVSRGQRAFSATGISAVRVYVSSWSPWRITYDNLSFDPSTKANLADPTFTGVPRGPTAAVGNSTTQLATTAFVNAEIANDAPSKTGTGASGTWGISVTGNAATASTARPTTTTTTASDLDTHSMLHTSFNGANLAGNPAGNGYYNYLMSSHQGGNYVSSALAMGHGGVNETYLGFATGPSADYLNRNWVWRKVWHEGTFDPATKLDVGSFGVGGNATGGAGGWNTITASGFYRMGGAIVDGAPTDSADHDVIHIQNANGDASQISITGISQFFFRCKDDGTSWGNWRTVYHDSNIANVPNAVFSIAKVNGLQTALDGKLTSAILGAPNGAAPLGADSLIPAQYLPSFVDDVLEFANLAAFPATGEAGKLFVTLDTNLVYRWSGSAYVNVGGTGGGVADSALRWQNSRTLTLTGKAAGSATFDGSANFNLNVTGLTVTKADVGLGNVDNTSDLAKPISTATQNALNLKLNIASRIGGQNLVINGSFEDAFDATRPRHYHRSGNATGMTGSQVSSVLPSGLYAWRIEASDSADGQYTDLQMTETHGGAYPTAAPGDVVTTSVSARGPIGTMFRTFIQFIDAGGANILQTTGPFLTLTETYQRFTLTSLAAPVNTVKVRAYVGRVYNQSGGNMPIWMEMDDFQIQTGTQATEFSPHPSDLGRLKADVGGGNATGTWPVSITGAAAFLSTPRAFSLSGIVTAPQVNFDGLGNVVMTTAIADAALSQAKVSGLVSALAAKADAASTWNHSGLIGASANLDTYNTIGIYHQNTNANAASGTNYPIALAGRLVVYTMGSMCYQEYTAYHMNSTYRRGWYSNSWSPWYEILDTRNTDLSTKANVTSPTFTTSAAIAGGALATTAGANTTTFETRMTTTNIHRFQVRHHRRSAGTGWTTASVELRAMVDVTDHTFIRMGGGSGDTIWLGEGTTERHMFSPTQVSLSGNLHLTGATQAINFGSTAVRQMINLWNEQYGIGIQNNTMYFRTGMQFAWFKDGSHQVDPLAPGSGGTLLGYLDQSGHMYANTFRSLNGSTGIKYYVGDDATINDIAIANHLGINGAQNANVGGIRLGNTGPSVSGDSARLTCDKEIATWSANAFRAAFGNYGAIWRNDGGNLYLLFTASGDSWGSWNGLRPMTFELANGNVTFGHHVAVTGQLGVGVSPGGASAINASTGALGAQAGHYAQYQGGVRKWQIGVETDRAWMLWSYNDSGALVGNVMKIYTDAQSLVGHSGGWTAGGMLNAGRVSTGWDSGVAGAVSCNNWFRAAGNTGIYFDSYGGGWNMTDSTYIRAYNGKSVTAADFVLTSDERKKRGIRPMKYNGRLEAVEFVYAEDGKADFGFSAQKVREKYPLAVDLVKEDKEGGLQDMHLLSYHKLTAVLSMQANLIEDDLAVEKKKTAALEAKVKAQAEQIGDLNERLARMEGLLQQLLERQ